MKYKKERKSVDWVRAGYECTTKRVLRKIYDHVKSDIKIMEEIQQSNQSGEPQPKFMANCNGTTLVVVREEPYPSERTVVEVRASSDGKLEVSVLGGGTLTIDIKWNFENGVCELRINGEGDPKEIWQINQVILSGLFFR